MPILDDSDLQDLAALVTDLAHKDDCTITHMVTTEDPYGTEEAGTVTTRTVKCLAVPIPRPALLQAYDERIGAFSKYNLHFPLGQGPAEGDTVTINGQTLVVQNVDNPKTFSVEDTCLAAGEKCSEFDVQSSPRVLKRCLWHCQDARHLERTSLCNPGKQFS